MKKNVFVAMLGAIALALGVGLNTQNALNDYGIGENSLSLFVQAQTSSSKTGTETGIDGFDEPKNFDCGITITGDVKAAASALGFKLGTVTAGGGLVLLNAGTKCERGGELAMYLSGLFYGHGNAGEV